MVCYTIKFHPASAISAHAMTQLRTISHTLLIEWIRKIFARLGVPGSTAHLIADSLVAANLRGVDSHGVHLVPYYAEHIRRGLIDIHAGGRPVAESGACLVYDGERAFGQCVSQSCCDHAVRLGRVHGLGLVAAGNSNHFGAAAYWGRRLSDAGMIGIVMCNASPSVPPWQGREGRVGTNPICVSVPATGDGGWLLDMATTTVAWNKVLRARVNRQPALPSGWALDEHGIPTTATDAARFAMPLGGYKGSGLALMAEILCAVLSGGALSTAVGGTFLYDRPMSTSQMFLAIEAARFASPEEFQSRMESLLALVKSAAPADGYDEVLVAGEPEWRIEAERRESGIPIDEGTWSSLTGLSGELNVEGAGE